MVGLQVGPKLGARSEIPRQTICAERKRPQELLAQRFAGMNGGILFRIEWQTVVGELALISPTRVRATSLFHCQYNLIWHSGGLGFRMVKDRLGMWVTLASIFMLFAGLVAAYALVLPKQALWKPVRIPWQMWLSTLALVLSSIALQTARFNLRRGRLGSYKKLLTAAVGLGVIFLLSQMMAWSDLALQGVFMMGNPHGSMWFCFTGFHTAHFAGGMIAMSMLLCGAGRLRHEDGEPPLRKHRNFAALTAMYWHFTGALWVALFGLLQWWN